MSRTIQSLRRGVGAYESEWKLAMPGLFVLLWSTGFIGARLGLPYAEPFTFLALRMAIATGLLAAVSVLTAAPWPRTLTGTLHVATAGLLVHGVYLGGVFWAIGQGLSAGVTAIIVALQPLLTAVLAGAILGERLLPRQWLGFVLGLVGVVLVVLSQLSAEGVALVAVAGALAALAGITLGTLYQKRFCPDTDLRSGGTIQYLVSAVALFAMAAAVEDLRIDWTGEFIFALAWLVLVLSVGAVGLLFALIRQGAASKVASLFYLAPPLTAILGYLLFDEALEGLALAGMAVAIAGVALVNLRAQRAG